MSTRVPIAALSATALRPTAEPVRGAQFALQEAGFALCYLQENLYAPVPGHEELLQTMRTAELLVLDLADATGTAQEHLCLAKKLGRTKESTVLFSPRRRGRAEEGPFTHFHHQGKADLVRQFRRFLGVSEPVAQDHLAHILVFHAVPEVFGLSDVFVSRAILCALQELRFSGRVEAYTRTDATWNKPQYQVALGLRKAGTPHHPARVWSMEFETRVARALLAQDAGVVLAREFCRFSEVFKYRQAFAEEGVVEFLGGAPTRVLHSRRAAHWFELAALSSIHGELPRLQGQSSPRPASESRL